MSKSYRGYAELADWMHRAGRRPHKRKARREWKQEILRETEEMAADMNVYVIINEWTDTAGNTSSEVTGDKFFLSEDDAWAALQVIAEAHDTDLDVEETSIQFEDHKSGLQYEEYRIEELTHG